MLKLGYFRGSVYIKFTEKDFLKHLSSYFWITTPCWQYAWSDSLSESDYQDDLDHIVSFFDRTTKPRFKDPGEPQYIKFGLPGKRQASPEDYTTAYTIPLYFILVSPNSKPSGLGMKMWVWIHVHNLHFHWLLLSGRRASVNTSLASRPGKAVNSRCSVEVLLKQSIQRRRKNLDCQANTYPASGRLVHHVSCRSFPLLMYLSCDNF